MHADSGRNQTRQLIAALAGISVFGLSFGLLYPLMALNLEGRGFSASYIGIIAAMQPLGLVMSNFLLPTVVARTGVGGLLKICIGAISLVFAVYPFLPPTPCWFLLRFVHGALASSIYVVSEAIIVRLSVGERATRVLALYTAVMQTTFGIGPLILLLTGVDGPAGFLTGAILTIVGGLIMILGGAGKVELYDEGERKPFLSVLWQIKFLLAGYAVFAFADAVTADLLPVYGKLLDFSTTRAALLLTAFLFGSTILQIPLSFLFSKVDETYQLPLNVSGVALSFLALVFTWDTALVWPVIAIAGALTSSINTISLTQVGRYVAARDLVAGTASLTTSWGVIYLIATPIAGIGMDSAGPQALPYSVVIFGLLSLAVLLIGSRRRTRRL
ncbi:MFS transporter [Aestuariivirga sp.]|uniref:MFS transporter n=1 Tax=Aestuariivirga sp. TaxID=2650926 RepID=UPI003BA9B5E5